MWLKSTWIIFVKSYIKFIPQLRTQLERIMVKHDSLFLRLFAQNILECKFNKEILEE